MIILLITLLSVIVIGAVMYPIVRPRSESNGHDVLDTGENSVRMAADGLNLAQLDLAVGNLDQESYDQLEGKYRLESGEVDLKDEPNQGHV